MQLISKKPICLSSATAKSKKITWGPATSSGKALPGRLAQADSPLYSEKDKE